MFERTTLQTLKKILVQVLVGHASFHINLLQKSTREDNALQKNIFKASTKCLLLTLRN